MVVRGLSSLTSFVVAPSQPAKDRSMMITLVSPVLFLNTTLPLCGSYLPLRVIMLQPGPVDK